MNTVTQTSVVNREELCQQIRSTYDAGRYVQAYEMGRAAWGQAADWPGTDARVLALRLAANLGAPRLADWLTRLAYRGQPDHAEALYYEGRRVGRRRGPYAGYRWLRARGEFPANATAEVRASWYTLWGEFTSSLRDFDAAEAWLRLAEQADPTNPWVKVCQAASREREDRYDEAAALARAALELRPDYRPAVQSLAHLLIVQGRDDEAIELLQGAGQRMECFALYAQLVTLQLELKQYAAARDSLAELERLAVLAEKPLPQWIAGIRGEVTYFLGDVAESIRWSRQSDSKFWKTVADRLENPAFAAARSITLPVGFVRQHHSTCAPATLAALSRFWEMPVDHLQVADEICYNGTSSYSERKWADSHGWVTREFSVTETSAQQLIDLGIPFTFTTVDPGNSHLQAVIGYDGRRGTLVLRDPYWRNTGEALVTQLLERYLPTGPRGMALVPQSRAELLSSVDLPDADLWDELHELDRALVEHHREAAQRHYASLLERAPDHRLTWEARRRLAIYDGNATEHLAAVDKFVEAFPHDQRLELERLSLLRHQARRDERLATYARRCARQETHPIFWQQYAQELRVDARRWGEAIELVRRALARWPSEAANYLTLAHIYWDQRRYEEALELYRIAACLGDKDEQYVLAYFSAADWFKQTDTALRLLHDRCARFGRKSSDPARSLASAYVQLDRYREALAVIEEALALRPEDGELLLYAADLYATSSSEYLPRVRELVEQARGQAPRALWLRTAARLAVSEDRPADALELWREVLELSPLALDAHTALVRLLFAREGDAAAQQHLAAACARFPHHIPLHELWVEWVREEPVEVREPIVRRLIEVSADNAWAHRELGFLLGSQRRLAEAWVACETAGRLEPSHPSQFLLQARLLQAEERTSEAKQALRQALATSIDNDAALAGWMDLCETLAERRTALEFFQEQLEQQVIFGDGLLAFREHAASTLEPAELLGRLQDALRHRPDLWHAWSAVILQLLDTDQLDEAWRVACEATSRFPLLPRLWLDRAEVCRARLDGDGEREALENAYRINPSWGVAVRRWCSLLYHQGDYVRATEILTAAVARQPHDAAVRMLLAETQWKQDQRDAALETVRQAVQTEPGLSRGWDLLQHWSQRMERPELPRTTARELTARRPGDSRSWLVLGRMLDQPEEVEERLAAFARAIELGPRNYEVRDLLAETLAQLGRYDEALDACHPALFGDHPPTALRGRAAWVLAERGDLPGAIERMRAVLAEEPYYYWGWSRLADWTQATQDLDGYLEASQWLVRISPQYEVSLGYLGEARLLKGDRDGAREAFERAFELNPRYDFAGLQLVDMHLDDGQLEAAADVLARLRKSGRSNLFDARAVRLAARQGDMAAAQSALEAVFTDPEHQPWALNVAVRALVDAGAVAEVRACLEDWVMEKYPISDVGWKWVEQCCANGPVNLDAQLARVAQRSEQSELTDAQRTSLRELSYTAVGTYLQSVVDRKDGAEAHRFAAVSHEWLRRDSELWGWMGWAFSLLRDYRAAAGWFSDWRSRSDARPWALAQVTEALQNTGREQEAVECSRWALTLPPSRGLHLHHLWLAADAALAGNSPAARESLRKAEEAVGDTPRTDNYTFLRQLIEFLLETQEVALADRRQVFARLAPRLLQTRLEFMPYCSEPARGRIYRHVLGRVAALRGGLAGWCWYLWHRHRTG